MTLPRRRGTPPRRRLAYRRVALSSLASAHSVESRCCCCCWSSTRYVGRFRWLRSSFLVPRLSSFVLLDDEIEIHSPRRERGPSRRVVLAPHFRPISPPTTRHWCAAAHLSDQPLNSNSNPNPNPNRSTRATRFCSHLARVRSISNVRTFELKSGCTRAASRRYS